MTNLCVYVLCISTGESIGRRGCYGTDAISYCTRLIYTLNSFILISKSAEFKIRKYQIINCYPDTHYY